MATKVYLAHAMSGRSGKDLLTESQNAKAILAQYNIVVLDPVEVEDVQPQIKKVAATEKELKKYWRRDKEMIREADVLLDLTGPMKSEGVAHEIGYSRYCLWIPTVRIYPVLGTSVARLEDDFIVKDLHEAGEMIRKYWGSYPKRLHWRLTMLYQSLPKWVLRQIWRLFQ